MTSTCGAPGARLSPSSGSSCSGPAACAGRRGPARSPGSRPRPAPARPPAPRTTPHRTRPAPAAGTAGRRPCPPTRLTPEHPAACPPRARRVRGRTFPYEVARPRQRSAPVRTTPTPRAPPAAGRRRGGPAARALQARQHPVRHRPGDLHVHHLRPPRRGRRPAVQPGAAQAPLLPLARRAAGQGDPRSSGPRNRRDEKAQCQLGRARRSSTEFPAKPGDMRGRHSQQRAAASSRG